MRVVVIGAGVIGVTTAYYLARDGHQVTVVDRLDGVGRQTSYANAGEITPGGASPWAAPGLPRQALGWLFKSDAPLVLRPPFSRGLVGWGVRLLANCNAAAFARNAETMVRLAKFSCESLGELRQETGISYSDQALGSLHVFGTEAELAAAARQAAALGPEGPAFEILDQDGCLQREPGLSAAARKLAGGLRFPDDETGDCHAFTVALAEHCRGLGVTFRLGVAVRRLETTSDLITRACADNLSLEADTFVLAAGSHSTALAGAAGLPIPVHPVKGYSLTLPIEDEARAPVSTVMDVTRKVAITRLDSRIRVGGLAELSGFSSDLPTRRRRTLLRALEELFPGAGDPAQAEFWCGHRPMTPDGPPLIGQTGFANLVLNTGHGTLGWTMACGSGRIAADAVKGIEPAEVWRPLEVSRFRS